MILTETVFVLGAGASADFHFPLGSELADQIIKHIQQPVNVGNALTDLVEQAADVNLPMINMFRKDLVNSNRSSIDRFLQTRPDYLKIGKACIAATLIPFESDKAFANARGKWMSYLMDHMLGDEDPESFRSNKLTVVTFNFDRSFERFLYRTLLACYHIEKARAIALTKHVPVFHVHGDLGAAEWLGESQLARKYTPIPEIASIQIAASRIRLVHEEVTEDTLAPAVEAIRRAKRVCFIGFGFDRANLNRLKMNEPLPGAELHATVLNVTDAEMRPVIQFCGRNRFNLHHGDALSFLRNVGVVHE